MLHIRSEFSDLVRRVFVQLLITDIECSVHIHRFIVPDKETDPRIHKIIRCMKYSISGIIIGLVSLLSSVSADEWIRINQLGYLPESPKVAVFMSEGKAAVEEYVLVEVFTGEIVKRLIIRKRRIHGDVCSLFIVSISAILKQRELMC